MPSKTSQNARSEVLEAR